VRNAADIAVAIADASRRPAGGLIVVPDSLPIVADRSEIVLHVHVAEVVAVRRGDSSTVCL
jgi:hypothetical protein